MTAQEHKEQGEHEINDTRGERDTHSENDTRDIVDEELAGYEEMSAFCDMLTLERNVSPNTVRNYRVDLLDYLRWAQRTQLDPLMLTHKQMRGYLSMLDQAHYARSTIHRRLSALRSFFRWLNLTGRIDNDPASVLTGPKVTKSLPHVIKADEMVRLLDVHKRCSDYDHQKTMHDYENMRDLAVLEFLYACGARVSEASNLRLADVDLDHNRVKVFGKGSKERIIPIHDLAVSAMHAYLIVARPHILGDKTSEFFFVTRRGNRMSPDAIRKMFKETVREAGLDEDLSPHAMRHTFATDMLTGGADLRSVQEMLGHSSLSTTQIYTHISPAHLKQAHSQAHPRA